MDLVIDTTDLLVLENLRQDFQRQRIRMSNRINAIERGESMSSPSMPEYYMSEFYRLEQEVTELIAETVKDHEIWPWLEAVKGIGPGLAGSLLAPIDIHEADSVSALWRFAGQGVNDSGRADRPTKGEKLVYNASLKRVCWQVSTSFLRTGSPYRAEYDEAKEYYQKNRADWNKMHIDLAARRKMIKLFLSHLWELWRFESGYDLRVPYAIGVLGHDGYKPVTDYVPKDKYEYPYEYLEWIETVMSPARSKEMV